MLRLLLVVSAISLMLISCKKDTDPISPGASTDSLISIRTLTVDSSSAKIHRAIVFGDISDDGGEDILQRGVCWALHSNPTTADSTAINGRGTGIYSVTLPNLISEKRYFAKAFAKNKYGTVYGNRVSFIVRIVLPAVSYKNSSTTARSIEATFYVATDGGSPVIEQGVYFDTTREAELNGKKIIASLVSDTFTISISGLIESTNYYFKPYAITKAGTGLWYPSNMMTKSLPAPIVTTLTPPARTRTSITAAGSIYAPSGNTILDKGVQYTNFNNFNGSGDVYPKVSAGSDAGSFTVTIPDLNANTFYTLRAYVRTPAGWFFGQEVRASTLQ